MNWTGGRLQTSRNAGSNVTIIQKKHFAKVRARVQRNPNTLSTFQLSWAQPQVVEVNPFRHEVFSQFNHGRDPKAHQIYTNLDTPTPISPQQFSKPLPDQRSMGAGGPDPQIERSGSTRSPSLIELSSRACAESTDSTGVHGPRVRIPSPPDDDDIGAQRRKLLLQRDWVGLEIKNPPKMTFPNMNERDRIGKRHRLKETDHNRNQGCAIKRIKPNIEELKDLTQRKRPVHHHHLEDQDVSVRIGSSIHGTQPTCMEASMQRNPSHSSPESEEMLLDHETYFVSHSRDQPRSTRALQLGRSVQPLPPNARYESTVGSNLMSDDRLSHSDNRDKSSAKPFQPRKSPMTRRHARQNPNSRPCSVNDAPGRLIFSSSPCRRAFVSDRKSTNQVEGGLKQTICILPINAGLPIVAPSEGSENMRWKGYLDIPASSAIDDTSATRPTSMAVPCGVVISDAIIQRDQHPERPDQVVIETTRLQADEDVEPHPDIIALSPGRPHILGSNDIPPPHPKGAKALQGPKLNPLEQLEIAQRKDIPRDIKEASRTVLVVDSAPDEDLMWYSFVFGDGILEDSRKSLGDDKTAKDMHRSSSPLPTCVSDFLSKSISETKDGMLDTLSLIANASESTSMSPLSRDSGLNTLSLAANVSDCTPTTLATLGLDYPSSFPVPSSPARRYDNLASSPDELARSMNSSLFEGLDDTSQTQTGQPTRSKVVFTKPSPFRVPRYRDPPPTIRLGKSFRSSVIRGDRDVTRKKMKASKREKPKVVEAMDGVEEIEDD